MRYGQLLIEYLIILNNNEISVVFINVNKTEMNNKGKSKKSIKNISRFRIKNKYYSNPEEYKVPKVTYFHRIDGDRSLLNEARVTKNDLKKWNQSKITTYNKSNESRELLPFSQNSLVYKNIINQQDSLSFYQTSKTVIDKTTDNSKINILGKNIETKNTFSKIQDQQKILLKKQYMSYSEYEQLIEKGKVMPIYFQKIANKNDEKHQTSLQDAVSEQKLEKKQKQKKQIFKSANSLLQGLKAAKTKSNRTYTQITNHTDHRPAQTIISSAVGTLSNYSIMQKLEQRWQGQFKANKLNLLLFTQQSEIGSDKDTKQFTLRDQITLGTFKRKQKNESVINSPSTNELDTIENERYKTQLKKIFTVKQAAVKTEESQKYSRGEEYLTYEQNMVKFNSIYKPKKYVLKHKLEWKV